MFRLIYKDYAVGTGERPVDGQQVTFDYTGYNESGARIDNTYSRGYPAETQLGVGGLIPGGHVAVQRKYPLNYDAENGSMPDHRRRTPVVP